MKCSTCGKEIPETSQVCPFCYSTIDRSNYNVNTPTETSVTTINTEALATINTAYQSESNEVDFGALDSNTSFDDDQNTLQAYIQEPKKRKKILLPIIIVFLLFGLVFVVLFILKGPKVEGYKYYTGISDGIYNYINDNFTGIDSKNAGSYKIYYTINNETKEFRGDYQLDLHKKLLDITATLKNPEEEQGGIVINDRTLEMELVGKNSDLYFISKNIYQTPILLPYEDETGLLSTKQYNLDILVDSVHDAFNTALKSMSYTEEKKVHTSIKEKDMVVNRQVLTLDYNAKKVFTTTFYDALLNDYNFISEYAKIKGKKADEIEKVIQNLKKSAELKYSSDDGKTIYANIYYKGKEVYKLEIDCKNIDNSVITVDFDSNKFVFERKVEDKTQLKVAVSRLDSYMNDVLTRTYMIDVKYNDQTITINLELTKQNNPNIKVKDVQGATSIRDFTKEQMDTLKNTVNIYTDYSDFVYQLQKIFGSVCSPELSCVCNDEETCQCNHDSNIITCPKSVVQPKVEEQPTITNIE